jgi:hypothetical protein
LIIETNLKEKISFENEKKSCVQELLLVKEERFYESVKKELLKRRCKKKEG